MGMSAPSDAKAGDGPVVIAGSEEDANDDAEDEFIITEAGSAEDGAFDETVGALEQVAISDEFQALLRSFSEEHCHHFEDTEENKLIYTDIFKKYSESIESFLDEKLKEAIPGFEMEKFLEELVKRGEDAIDSEMFDLLASLGDFDVFKQQMLAAKLGASVDDGSRLDLGIRGTAAR